MSLDQTASLGSKHDQTTSGNSCLANLTVRAFAFRRTTVLKFLNTHLGKVELAGGCVTGTGTEL